MSEIFAQQLVDTKKRLDRLEEEMARGASAFLAMESLVRTLADISKENQKQITTLVEETRSLVQLYRDVRGAARLGARAQGFLLWVAKWPVIGAGVIAILHGTLNYLKSKGIDL